MAADRDPSPRSTLNHGLIVARSCHDLGSCWSEIEVNFVRNWSGIVAPKNRSHDSFKQCPRPLPMATMSGPISLFKSMYFPLFVLQLLSEFRGRSLVHRVPPVFRLDSEGIGAGLIANSSLISSNFPLEFRKSVRKDPSKFTPIRANWSLILVAIGLVVRFDRLSRGNLSFY